MSAQYLDASLKWLRWPRDSMILVLKDGEEALYKVAKPRDATPVGLFVIARMHQFSGEEQASLLS